MRCRGKIFIPIVIFILWVVYTLTYKKETVQWNKRFSRPVQFHRLRQSSNGKYKILDNVYKVTLSTAHLQIDIGVATQTSVRNIHQLVELAKHWKGPLSVAVFVPGGEFEVFKEALHLLIQCHKEELWRSASFHAIIPLSHPPEEDVLNLKPPLTIDTQSCNRLSTLLHGKNYENEIPYPVNSLRNAAIHNLNTSHVLLLDVDMIPRANLRERILQEKILLNVPLQALVIPAFEMTPQMQIPITKEDLLVGWDSHMIRPFYSKVCEKCQHQTDYNYWKTNNDELGYSVSWQDPWEPFYIAHKTNIQYDERFEQYGFNRISQLCHLHMMRYTFFVLREEFLLHKGFKEPRLFHTKKDEENRYNKMLYGKLKQEMLVRYPKTLRHC